MLKLVPENKLLRFALGLFTLLVLPGCATSQW